jgi:hypothetical protein
MGIAKDVGEANRWWLKAAEGGIPEAQYNVGMAYHNGTGVEKNEVQAYFWTNLAAASLDLAFVRKSRDEIGKLLAPAQLAEVQARCQQWAEAHQPAPGAF